MYSVFTGQGFLEIQFKWLVDSSHLGKFFSISGCSFIFILHMYISIFQLHECNVICDKTRLTLFA